MKSAFTRLTLALGILLIGTLLSGKSFSACADYGKPKVQPQSWNGQSSLFLPISASASDDRIVGMWHVTFTAEGNEAGPPDGTPIDNAMVVWHNDGTEIMNSNRPAQDGNFCLGVWEKIGKSRYKLSHIPWQGNDTANAPSGIGNPTGAAQIVEEVTLSADCKHYTGTFTLDAYDTSGNSTAHIVGVITGTRVTVDTRIKDLL
jgi:hypothetical protein